jgi:prepilin peptidase CpaA
MIDSSLYPLIRVLAIGCGLVGAVTDLRSRRIPNWLTFPTMLLGVALHLMVGGWKEGASSLFGLLACGTVFLVFYLAGGMGAGDVKLIAAEASLLGLPCSGSLLLYTVLCGGGMGLVLAIKRGRLRHTALNVLQLFQHHKRNGLQPHPELNLSNQSTLRLPYAVAIACGCVLTVYMQSFEGIAR